MKRKQNSNFVFFSSRDESGTSVRRVRRGPEQTCPSLMGPLGASGPHRQQLLPELMDESHLSLSPEPAAPSISTRLLGI